jgi:uncharacterized membrane protein YkvA (DUF1232 family)
MGWLKLDIRSQAGGQPSWARAKLGLKINAITPLWRFPTKASMAPYRATAAAAASPRTSVSNDAANSQRSIDPEVLPGVAVDENLLMRLVRRAGRIVARPALECFEMLLDGGTPHQARLTVLAALTYLLLPVDLIPDFLPAIGFGDDMVALTALLSLCGRHLTPEIRRRAQSRLDRWFPTS